MKAAYKWRLQNGVYGYITDETGGTCFIYTVSTRTREYWQGDTIPGSNVDENKISHLVSTFSEEEYIDKFNDFKAMIDAEYPSVSLLDVYYYYNMENDECVESASSLKCAATDIIFTVGDVESGNEPAVTIDAINTSTAEGNIEYVMNFTLAKGDKGDKGEDGQRGADGITPNISANATIQTLDPDQSATVNVIKTGTAANPNLKFQFGIPRGKGVDVNNNITVNNVTAENITTTNITTENITTENIVTSSITTNYISDRRETYRTDLNEGENWYTIYSGISAYSTARIGISRMWRNSEPEVYYLEVNFGYNGGNCSIALLNGTIGNENKQTIKAVRLNKYDTSTEIGKNHANLEVLIESNLSNGGSPYFLTNIEGCGIPVAFEKVTRTDGLNVASLVLTEGIRHNAKISSALIETEDVLANSSVDCSNGWVGAYTVETKAIKDTNSTLNITSDSWYEIYSVKSSDLPNTVRISISTAYETYMVSFGNLAYGNNSYSDSSTISISNGLVHQHDMSQRKITHLGLYRKSNSQLALCMKTSAWGSGEKICRFDNIEGSGSRQFRKITNTDEIDAISEIIETGEGTVTNNITINQGGTNVELNMPIGSIIMWAGISSRVPSGWMWCDGRSLSTTSYPDLYSCLGYMYGGSGNNFKIPDLRQRFPLGYGEVIRNAQTGEIYRVFNDSTHPHTVPGKVGGEEFHTLTSSEIPTHNHEVTMADFTGQTVETQWRIYDNGGSHSGADRLNYSVIDNDSWLDSKSYLTTKNTGGNGSHNNVPPYQVVNFIIKYK